MRFLKFPDSIINLFAEHPTQISTPTVLCISHSCTHPNLERRFAAVAQLYAILSQLFSHVLHFSQEDYILLVGLVGIAASISNRDSFIPERKIGGRE